ncbi:hypothetical protein [Vibrio sp. V10_P2A27P122]|nr:hypothetical protein VAA_00665 [Vibrio anguillarum 775]ARV28269.1 hypothetical protein A6A12_2934 [Vibrio anguillarum]
MMQCTTLVHRMAKYGASVSEEKVKPVVISSLLAKSSSLDAGSM